MPLPACRLIEPEAVWIEPPTPSPAGPPSRKMLPAVALELVPAVETTAFVVKLYPASRVTAPLPSVIFEPSPNWMLPPACQVKSEERRVGKECRSRWSPYQEKK